MAERTQVIVLGVDHAPQLVAETYQPAVFRAFFDRVNPAAICIERSPQELARSDFYEFTYEVQYITVPYAKERGIPLYPIDWLPAPDDQMLAWGMSDIDTPPFVRKPKGFQGFVCFPDTAALSLDLFFAESEAARARLDSWYDQPRSPGERDFPRRLGLYRTFMQAMRIKAVAKAHPGQKVLVVVGYFHKADIEQILGDDASIEFIQPSAFGRPADEEVAGALDQADLYAIASFNLLGVQLHEGPVNWEWLSRVVQQLNDGSAESGVFNARFGVLTGSLSQDEAIRRYEALLELPSVKASFTFTGVKDRRRIDSFYDPFGNLSIYQRVMLELAREYGKLGDTVRTESAKERLLHSPGLSALQVGQLEAYWQEYVMNRK